MPKFYDSSLEIFPQQDPAFSEFSQSGHFPFERLSTILGEQWVVFRSFRERYMVLDYHSKDVTEAHIFGKFQCALEQKGISSYDDGTIEPFPIDIVTF
jgi:hypothetical protein